MILTEEQNAIIAAGKESSTSLMIQAYAGCAKTTTLVELAKVLPPIGGLALAFNKKIKEELEKRLPANFTAMTFNGLGHRAWGSAIGRSIELDPRKIGRIASKVIPQHNLSSQKDAWLTLVQLVSKAQNSGLVPAPWPQTSLVSDTEDGWASLLEIEEDLHPTILRAARQILSESIQEAYKGIINYSDQIYMSALFGGMFPRFPVVMGDEMQDASPLNHIQLTRTGAGRLVIFGDDRQAIYGFRGADHTSMAKIRKLREEWKDLPLRKTFRCPRRHVTRQLAHAPGFNAAPNNPEGVVLDWTEDSWSWSDVTDLFEKGQSIAILSRNNAPLVGMAFALLRRKVKIVMLGRDIGKNLVALAEKVAPEGNPTLVQFLEMLTAWEAAEVAKARANGQENRVEQIRDRVECFRAISDDPQVTSLAVLKAAIRDIFSKEAGQVTLSTGHKAKGLEWDVVLHLDPWRIPSKFSQRAAANGNTAPLTQEKNLRYVIETRSRHTLILANRENFE